MQESYLHGLCEWNRIEKVVSLSFWWFVIIVRPDRPLPICLYFNFGCFDSCSSPPSPLSPLSPHLFLFLFFASRFVRRSYFLCSRLTLFFATKSRLSQTFRASKPNRGCCLVFALPPFLLLCDCDSNIYRLRMVNGWIIHEHRKWIRCSTRYRSSELINSRHFSFYSN